MYRRDRNLDDNGEVIRGGRVLMYITNNLKHYEIDHDVNNTESLWCTIQTAHGNSVKLGVCYDSTSNTKEDSDRLYNIMRTECQLNTIVCGDFNRPGINWDDMTSDKHGERLLECSMDLFLSQHINDTTTTTTMTLFWISFLAKTQTLFRMLVSFLILCKLVTTISSLF